MDKSLYSLHEVKSDFTHLDPSFFVSLQGIQMDLILQAAHLILNALSELSYFNWKAISN